MYDTRHRAQRGVFSHTRTKRAEKSPKSGFKHHKTPDRFPGMIANTDYQIAILEARSGV